MSSIDKVVSTYEKLIITTWVEFTFIVIKDYLYENPIYLLLSW